MERASPLPTIPLWAWPTVLALDAPLVAVAWQWACAVVLGVAVRPAEVAVLALSVWLAYSADRLLDGVRLAARGAGVTASLRSTPLRHAFATLQRRPLGITWLLVLAVDLALATTLTRTSLRAGSGLLVLVALYFVAVHAPRLRRALPRWLGALQVGVLVAGGAALFPLAEALSAAGAETTGIVLRTLLPALLTFGALCCANVLLIERWEIPLDDGRPPAGSIRSRGGGRVAALATLAAAVLLASDLSSGTRPGRLPFDTALLAAGTLLLALTASQRLPPELRRVLADAVLLTPLLVLPLAAALSGGRGG